MGIGKTGECTSDISQIKNHACCEKYFKENKHNNLEWQYAHIFVLGHNMFFTICHSCSKQSETVRFSEQIMSADKIISDHIFVPNGGYCLYLSIS